MPKPVLGSDQRSVQGRSEVANSPVAAFEMNKVQLRALEQGQDLRPEFEFLSDQDIFVGARDDPLLDHRRAHLLVVNRIVDDPIGLGLRGHARPTFGCRNHR
jgi:hypothetical protein